MSDIEKKYPIPEAPEYDTEIRSLQNTDPANADEIFNPLIQKIIDNIHAVKLSNDTKAREDLSNVLDNVFLEKVKAVGGDGSNLDADTVDGKHASDFAPAGFGLGTICKNLPSGSDLNNLPEAYKRTTGFFMGADLQNSPSELGGGWCYLIQLTHYTTNILQICFELSSTKEAGNIFIRQYMEGSYKNWTPWKKPDAATLEGKRASDFLKTEYNPNYYLGKTSTDEGGLSIGNGSGADFNTCNVDLKSWYGLGFMNANTKLRKIVFDLTNGKITTVGQIYADTNKKVWHEGNDGSGSGLDADLLDGKHAADFAPSGFGLGTRSTTLPNDIDLNDLPAEYKSATGFFTAYKPLNAPEELSTYWMYLIQMVHRDGYKMQMCFSLNSANNILLSSMYTRCYFNNTQVWTKWTKQDADTVDGKHATDFVESDDGHKIGLSFKANGGVQFRVDVTENIPVTKAIDSDTVDGKHAADFAPSGFGLGTNCAVIPDGTDLNNLPAQYKNATGFFTGGTLVNKPKELAGWIYLFQISGSAAYKVQMAFSSNGSDSLMGDVFIRQCKNNVWTAWKKPDASSVGGKSVSVLYSNCSTTAPSAYLGDNVQYQVY